MGKKKKLYEKAVNRFGDGGSGQPKRVTQAIQDIEQSSGIISPEQALQMGITFK